MKFVSLPHADVHPLSFYLAMEEYVARNVEESECFFHWQVEPTVIFGRNQLIENEVNLPYCRTNGIRMFRRKSGGGCVYADMSNIMFSYITDDINVSYTFDKYIRMVAFVLRKLGIPAEATGRNDIHIGGKKVSGNAFYHLPGKSIVHGTMLFNTDMEQLIRAITPSNEKLVSKGVESVRAHVTNLAEHTNISIEEFKAFVRSQMCDGEVVLSEEEVEKIKEIEKEYTSDNFIFGNNPRYTVVRKACIEGVGEMEARIEVKGGRIRNINLLGDYFVVGDIDEQLIRPLLNVSYERDAIEQTLKGINHENIIRNLKTENLLHLIISSKG